jgi:tRNA(Ile)-lysidine synthase
MIDKLAQTLKRLGLGEKDAILIAFSGGMDSTVLSFALLKLGYPISLAQCNFQLRDDDAEADAEFCRHFAQQNKVPFYLRRCETEEFAKRQKLSIQEAARELRYNFFSDLQEEHDFKAILTAHHADDNLETFLINFTRNGGINGLKGIPEKRDFFYRPLLGLTREELKKFAKKHSLTWREDVSNRSEKYQRNKYRLQLIPQWNKIEDDLIAKAKRSISLLQEQSRAFSELLHEKLQLAIHHENEEEILKVGDLKNKSYWTSILRFWLESKGNWDYSSIKNLWQSESGKSISTEHYTLYHLNGHYHLRPKKVEPAMSPKEISAETKTCAELKFRMLSLKQYPVTPLSTEAYLDFDKLSFPLTLRRWQAGDRFKPLGLSGTKKLSDYLTDIKINGPAKKEQLVLCSGKEIIWVVGSRIDHRYRVTNSTKTIYFVGTI